MKTILGNMANCRYFEDCAMLNSRTPHNRAGFTVNVFTNGDGSTTISSGIYVGNTIKRWQPRPQWALAVPLAAKYGLAYRVRVYPKPGALS